MALPAIGLIVAGLAYAFAQISDQPAVAVLLSGQDALPSLSRRRVMVAPALALLIVFKGIAYGLSLGSFRGGPTFPALFLGAAAGIMASHLPGLSIDSCRRRLHGRRDGVGAAPAAVRRDACLIARPPPPAPARGR